MSPSPTDKTSLQSHKCPQMNADTSDMSHSSSKAHNCVFFLFFIPVQRSFSESWQASLMHLLQRWRGGGLSTGLCSRLLVDCRVTERVEANRESLDKFVTTKPRPQRNAPHWRKTRQIIKGALLVLRFLEDNRRPDLPVAVARLSSCRLVVPRQLTLFSIKYALTQIPKRNWVTWWLLVIIITQIRRKRPTVDDRHDTFILQH